MLAARRHAGRGPAYPSGCRQCSPAFSWSDGRLPQALLSGVPARRGLRQADRAVGLLAVDCCRGDPPGRRTSARSFHRARVRPADLRRRVAVRSLFAVYPFAAEMFRRGTFRSGSSLARSRLAHSRSRWTRCPERRRSRTSSPRRSSTPIPGRRRTWALPAVFHSRRWIRYLEWRRREADARG